jgi:hypothetical protein
MRWMVLRSKACPESFPWACTYGLYGQNGPPFYCRLEAVNMPGVQLRLNVHVDLAPSGYDFNGP